MTRQGEGAGGGPNGVAGLDGVPITPSGSGRGARLALRALQAGAVGVVLAAVTHREFELDRFFVPKELVLHLTALVAGILALSAFRRVSLGRVDLLLALHLVLGGLSALAAQNGWLAVRALTLGASGLAVFWAARTVRESGLARPLLTALALAVVAGAATALLQAYGFRTDLFSPNRAPGGTLGNRNFVAHLAALGLPLVLLSCLRAWRGTGYLVGAVGVAILAATLVLTRSRAGWLAGAAALLVFLSAILLSGPLRRHGRTWGRLLGILVLLGAGVAAALLVPNTLRWRGDNPYLESARGVVNYEEGSGRGRLVQYGRSLRMAAAHPLLGVGPGNWAVAYPEYAAPRDPSLDQREAGRTSNPWPSSDWLAFVSERGFVATLLLLLAIGGIAMDGLRRLVRARDEEEGLAAAALLATITGTLIAGTFDAVLLLALPSLIAWAALGALWSPTPGAATPRRAALGVAALLAVTAVAAAGVVRSGAQLASMDRFAAGGNAEVERAARLDPGSYRAHLRLARSGPRARRCEHARAAQALFPSARAARDLARRCPD